MAAIQGINPVTGHTVWVDCVSGDGLAEGTAFVIRRSDPDAHTRLDTIATNTSNVNSALRDAWSYDTFVTSQAHRIVKASAGRLRAVFVHNRGTSTIFLMIFNQTAAPTVNATNFQLIGIPIFQGQVVSLVELFGPGGMAFSSGIVYGFSSNQNQYQAIASPTDVQAFVGFV